MNSHFEDDTVEQCSESVNVDQPKRRSVADLIKNFESKSKQFANIFSRCTGKTDKASIESKNASNHSISVGSVNSIQQSEISPTKKAAVQKLPVGSLTVKNVQSSCEAVPLNREAAPPLKVKVEFVQDLKQISRRSETDPSPAEQERVNHEPEALPRLYQESTTINHKRGTTKIHTMMNKVSVNCLKESHTPCDIEVDVASTLNPHEFWENVVRNELGPVNKVKPVDPTSDVPVNCLRFVCMSDTHNVIKQWNLHDFLKRVPPGDVLLHTGDFTLFGDEVQEYEDFNNFLGHLPHKLKLVIPGNHELYLDPRFCNKDDVRFLLKKRFGDNLKLEDSKDCINYLKAMVSNGRILIDEMLEICGIKIYGLPWVPVFGVMGFGLPRGYKLLEKYNKIPSGIDILMSHGPALGFCDRTFKGTHVGCAELLNSVRKRIRPKYVVHGHIHEDHGIETDGITTFINGSICDKVYNLSHDPLVFDLPIPDPFTREDFSNTSPPHL